MTLSERLKRLWELGAQTRRDEQDVKRNALPPLGSLQRRLMWLRMRELHWHTMTDAEKAEHRKLEREMQKDLDDYNAGDWTK